MNLTFNLSIGLYLFGSFVLFFLFFRFHLIHKRLNNRFASLFKMMALFSGTGMAIYSLFFIFFAKNSFYLFIGNTIGEPFIMLGFVYGLAAGLSFWKTYLLSKNIIFPVGVLVVFLSIFSHILFPFAPLIDKHGILHWNAHLVPGLVYSFFSFLGLMSLFLAFSWQAFKNKELRNRCGCLAAGAFLILVAGICLSLSKEKNIYLFALLIQSFGFILFLLASFIKMHKEEQNA